MKLEQHEFAISYMAETGFMGRGRAAMTTQKA